MKSRKRFFITIVYLVIFSMLMQLFSIQVFMDNTNTDSSNEIIEDTLQDEQSKYVPKYVEDEVIIKLTDTEETASMQFYRMYSKNGTMVSTSNNAISNSNKIESVGLVNDIQERLDLGLKISEMRLLNPSKEVTTDTSSSSTNDFTITSSTSNDLYSMDEYNNNLFCLKLDEIDVNEAINILMDNPLIEYAEPNYIYESIVTPNETAYEDNKYALEAINAENAWEITTGSKNVTVGVIDTGIDGDHSDLVDNLWNNPYYNTTTNECSICSYENDIHGYNFTGEGSSTGLPCGGVPTDTVGHGTHVAGIIGAKGNNTIGMCGVNWNIGLAWLGASIGNGIFSSDALIDAINYADNHNIPIVNCSLGGYGYSESFEEAISNYDGLVVVAAGNKIDGIETETNNNDDKPYYPASYNCSNIITVASTDKSNTRSDFSYYGPNSVHVAAPGSNIYSTWNNNTYITKSGTSMAAPHVAGIAALIKAQNPSFNTKQLKAAICTTVQSLNKTYDVMYDGGIVDAYAAVSVTEDSLKEITFDYNYSGSPSSFTEYAESGRKLRDPMVYPERDGFVFMGWHTSPTTDSLYDFNSTVSGNFTLYAHWGTVVTGSYADVFPDYIFMSIIIDKLNNELGGNRTAVDVISQSDYDYMANNIDELDVHTKDIRDLSGIEKFTGLKRLYCQYNRITTLDLTSLTKLEELNCESNIVLSSLNVSGLTSLKNITCNNNKITYLNVNTLKALETLLCYNNKLSTLVCSGASNLTKLVALNNSLRTLNVNTLSNLQYLNCSNNQLTSLTIKNLNQLQQLYCSDNNLTTLETGSGLLYLDCSDNQLTSLIIINSTNLTEAYCDHNNLTVFNISGLSNLETLKSTYNEMNSPSDAFSDSYMMTGRIVFNPQNTWSNNPFSDITNNIKAVEYVYNNGFMYGTSTTKFSPNTTLTRAQIAVILYNMAGTPSVVGLSNPFSDVSSTSYYCNAVKWVYNNGTESIMSGTSSTTFNPNGVLTRQMVAVIFNAYAIRNDVELISTRDYYTFVDEDDISSWAKNAVKNLYKANLMDYALDDNNLYFLPDEAFSRIDAAVLIRLFETSRLYL